MSRMKISGPTQGKLVFSYDIRDGHIDYKKLLPALNKRLVDDGIIGVAEEHELDDVIGEVLYHINEQVFEGLHDYFLDKKMEIDTSKILKEALEKVIKK